MNLFVIVPESLKAKLKRSTNANDFISFSYLFISQNIIVSFASQLTMASL